MVNSMRLSSVQPLINRAAGIDMTAWWIKGIKFVLSFLILTILLALTGGVIKTLLDLTLLLHNPVEVALADHHRYLDSLGRRGSVRDDAHLFFRGAGQSHFYRGHYFSCDAHGGDFRMIQGSSCRAICRFRRHPARPGRDSSVGRPLLTDTRGGRSRCPVAPGRILS